MRGSVIRRGRTSWRIKFDSKDENGEREYHVETVRGTRKDAEQALAKRLNEFAEGRYVAPVVETVQTYAEHWLENIAPAGRQRVTVQRYATLIRAHIAPGLGDVELQALDGTKIDRFYTKLRTVGRRDGGGLSTMTLHHVHTVLGAILKSAVKARKLARSPLEDIQTKPKPKAKRAEVLNDDEIATLLTSIKGTWLYMPTLLAACTGMRRGEVLGLRWRDIDFSSASLNVAQAVERVSGKPSLKEPKTDLSRRTIKLPASILPALAAHRKAEAERRLALGLGRSEMVFTSARDGVLIDPEVLSAAFTSAVVAANIGKRVTFHGLRHTHISKLLRAGVPVHAVSARAGHSKPSVTLNTYAHLIGGEDDHAAELADEMFRRVLK